MKSFFRWILFVLVFLLLGGYVQPWLDISLQSNHWSSGLSFPGPVDMLAVIGSFVALIVAFCCGGLAKEEDDWGFEWLMAGVIGVPLNLIWLGAVYGVLAGQNFWHAFHVQAIFAAAICTVVSFGLGVFAESKKLFND